jgi:hypothetical protein
MRKSRKSARNLCVNLEICVNLSENHKRLKIYALNLKNLHVKSVRENLKSAENPCMKSRKSARKSMRNLKICKIHA